MGEVISLDTVRPHLSGEVRCNSCGHNWVGVSPIFPGGDYSNLECPKCGLLQGLFLYPVTASEGEIIFQCNCGGEFFTIMTDGPRCMRCGQSHEWEIIL